MRSGFGKVEYADDSGPCGRRYRRLCGPKRVGELTKAIVKLSGAKPVTVCLHDTWGTGIANTSAALDAGPRTLGGSLGGCPFAPGATGNVVFEDLAFLCESKASNTGIDIEKLVAVRSILRSECRASRSMAAWPAPACRREKPAQLPDI